MPPSTSRGTTSSLRAVSVANGPNVLREGTVSSVKDEDEDIAQEDIADVHDAHPQNPGNGARERVKSTLTCRNDEGHALLAEPDITLPQHIGSAVLQRSSLCGFGAQPRPDGACVLLLRGVLVLCAHDIPLYRVENTL